ncbi:MAG: SIMPL domain-containing protein, partial [Acidobacteria bacterium]|nr:SIMPL domain-containing protein [Acidobacteriota bacterium]
TQSILIISPRVAEIEKLAQDPKGIFEGVVLENSNLEYFHSDLATIKRELLKDAMLDARARADVLASASSVRISRLLNSSVGVFQITEPFSTEVSDYGMYTTSTKQKDITVTVRASFMVQ